MSSAPLHVAGKLNRDLGAYVTVGEFIGPVKLEEPWPIEFDLADLLR